MSNPNTGHRILHVSYAVETIECTCGTSIQGEPDTYNPDRHGPLVKEWERHRRESGLTHNAGLKGPMRAKVTA